MRKFGFYSNFIICIDLKDRGNENSEKIRSNSNGIDDPTIEHITLHTVDRNYEVGSQLQQFNHYTKVNCSNRFIGVN